MRITILTLNLMRLWEARAALALSIPHLTLSLNTGTGKRERIMSKECYGCDRGFIAILHTCGTSARERFIDYLHKQERKGESNEL
jgi:hypothetical protein